MWVGLVELGGLATAVVWVLRGAIKTTQNSTFTTHHPPHTKTLQQPTQVHQELLGAYFAARHGLDYRSLRYPGIISARSAPGGGTTDYAVEIFHAALAGRRYTCFLVRGRGGAALLYRRDARSAAW
jgi:nucleoside-diphosphate-sugar epimerase